MTSYFRGVAMDKYKDPLFVQAVEKYLQEQSIKQKDLREFAEGVVAICDQSDRYFIFYDLRVWKGPVSISIWSKASIGRIRGETRKPPIKNFKEALKLAQESLRTKMEKEWLEDNVR